jgi:hypothetical protein
MNDRNEDSFMKNQMENSSCTCVVGDNTQPRQTVNIFCTVCSTELKNTNKGKCILF